ncbi:MAG: low specificity L-threonine aldolase, partial [Halobacteriota archaeon]
TDHRNARELARGIVDLEGLTVIEPESNMVLVHLDPALATADRWIEAGLEQGVGCSDVGPNSVRYVTHRDVSGADIEVAIDRIDTAHASLR